MAWSVLTFSGEEIIKLATDIERAGKKFYEDMSAKVDNPQVREMLSYLAREEEQHIKDFEELGKELPKEVVPNESYVGEYGDYIKAVIDNHIFNHDNIDKFVTKGLDVSREALALAFRFEKDSILIFQEFYNVVDDKGKKIIGELIDQEKRHISRIAQLYRLP